jgi:ribonuclease E
VREKVSFVTDSAPTSAEPVHAAQAAPAPAPSEPDGNAETSNDGGPRRAGWWSRRFGGGS